MSGLTADPLGASGQPQHIYLLLVVASVVAGLVALLALRRKEHGIRLSAAVPPSASASVATGADDKPAPAPAEAATEARGSSSHDHPSNCCCSLGGKSKPAEQLAVGGAKRRASSNTLTNCDNGLLLLPKCNDTSDVTRSNEPGWNNAAFVARAVEQLRNAPYVPYYSIERIAIKIPNGNPLELPPDWLASCKDRIQDCGLAVLGGYVREGCIQLIVGA